MRVFAVSGYSGTGKTSIIESIVQLLTDSGFSVVTVKSSQHKVSTDEEGKDTWRHRQAGAITSLFRGSRDRVSELVDGINADFLIVEGMKESQIPKFWCIGNADFRSQSVPQGVKAIIRWQLNSETVFKGIPILTATDTFRLLEIVKKEAIDLEELEI